MPRELPGRLLWLRRIARGLYYITKSSFKYCNRVWAEQSVRSTLGVQQLVDTRMPVPLGRRRSPVQPPPSSETCSLRHLACVGSRRMQCWLRHQPASWPYRRDATGSIPLGKPLASSHCTESFDVLPFSSHVTLVASDACSLTSSVALALPLRSGSWRTGGGSSNTPQIQAARARSPCARG